VFFSLFFEWVWTYVVLLYLVMGVSPSNLGDDKNTVLMHFGVQKLKLDLT